MDERDRREWAHTMRGIVGGAVRALQWHLRLDWHDIVRLEDIQGWADLDQEAAKRLWLDTADATGGSLLLGLIQTGEEVCCRRLARSVFRACEALRGSGDASPLRAIATEAAGFVYVAPAERKETGKPPLDFADKGGFFAYITASFCQACRRRMLELCVAAETLSLETMQEGNGDGDAPWEPPAPEVPSAAWPQEARDLLLPFREYLGELAARHRDQEWQPRHFDAAGQAARHDCEANPYLTPEEITDCVDDIMLTYLTEPGFRFVHVEEIVGACCTNPDTLSRHNFRQRKVWRSFAGGRLGEIL